MANHKKHGQLFFAAPGYEDGQHEQIFGVPEKIIGVEYPDGHPARENAKSMAGGAAAFNPTATELMLDSVRARHYG